MLGITKGTKHFVMMPSNSGPDDWADKTKSSHYYLKKYERANLPACSLNVLKAPEPSNLPPYTYQSIPELRHIRLLTLLPGKPTDPISCTTSIHPLDSLPPYHALSYVWGEGSDYFISCNGQSLAIRHNLFLALSHLRSPTTPLTIWIDAICINQSSIPERNQQVRYMRDIYAQAALVNIWLGEQSSSSPHAFRLIHALNTALGKEKEQEKEMLKEGQARDQMLENEPLTADDLESKCLPPPEHRAWQALAVLFWRPWFTRSWIIQELALSKTATVFCGEDTCPWTDFYNAASYISSHSLSLLTHVNPDRIIRLNNIAKQVDIPGTRRLQHVLCQARDSIATDPRDKVYALLGIASYAEALEFMPDYGKDAVGVFKELAKFCVERTGSLDILSAVEDRRGRTVLGMPKWVPDWTCDAGAEPFAEMEAWEGMRAAGETKPVVKFGKGDGVLVAEGWIVDSVACVGGVCEGVVSGGDSQVDGCGKLSFEEWQTMADALKKCPTGESFKSVYMRTLMAGGGCRPSVEHEKIGEDSTELERLYDTWTTYWKCRTQASDTKMREDEWLRAAETAKSIQRVVSGRRFFTTKKGYMGLGSASVRSDDKVVVLKGGKTPYVLHKRPIYREGYEFVGEAYVDGFMNGEALGTGRTAELKIY